MMNERLHLRRLLIVVVALLMTNCADDPVEFQNEPPTAASDPVPADNATDQPNDVDLTWKASDPEGDALTHDVYFGTVNNPNLAQSGLAETKYDPGSLEFDETYFWRVVSKDPFDNATSGPTWVFTTKQNQVPSLPTDPDPGNGSQNAPVTPVLSWSASDPDGDALTYDLYLGKSQDPPLIESDLTDDSYPVSSPLEFSTLYYWKIVVRDLFDNETEGSVWQFTTGANQPPNEPTNPVPADGTTGRAIDSDLQWSASDPDGDGLFFDVLFGTSDPPVTVGATDITAMTFDPGVLLYDQKYYWRIVVRDDFNNTTQGPVWAFTTVTNQPPNPPASPLPNDGSLNVDPLTVQLEWETSDPEDDPLRNDVLLDVVDPPQNVVAGDVSTNSFSPSVTYGQRYFWQIRVKDVVDNETLGPVWDFTTVANQPPSTPANPSPASGATDISPSNVQLGWESTDPEGEQLTYDVYFGTNSPPTTRVATDITSATYDALALTYDEQYFWQIVTMDAFGNKVTGPVWSFTTRAPVALSLKGSYNTSGRATDVAVSGIYAYVADSFSGLKIINISNPTSPSLTGSFSTLWAEDLAVSGNLVYVANENPNLVIINVSTPSNPVLAGELPAAGPFAEGVDIAGAYAYLVVEFQGLLVVDVSNPVNPNQVGRYAPVDGAEDVTVDGSHAYIPYLSTLTIVDVSNPASPSLAATYVTPHDARDAAIQGTLAYVVNGTFLPNVGDLRVVDITDPTSPSFVGALDIGSWPNAVAVSGNFVFVAADAGGLKVVDVTDPTNPKLAGFFGTTDDADGVAVVGDLVYIATRTAGLLIVDAAPIWTP